jgi:two-component system, NarL family, nitrate/nitrite response regulator NarL
MMALLAHVLVPILWHSGIAAWGCRPHEPWEHTPYAARMVRVLVIGEDPLARGGLASLLSDDDAVEVVGQAEGPRDLDTLRLRDAEAAVWDLGLLPDAEVDAAHALVAAGLAVVALVPDGSLVPDLVAAGIRGALFRDVPRTRLVAALEAASRGLVVLDPDLGEAAFRPRHAAPALVEPLTPRESEVLQLLAQGLTNHGIGQRLGVSDHTVKFHVNAILGKLGASSRSEAIVMAARTGLVVL